MPRAPLPCLLALMLLACGGAESYEEATIYRSERRELDPRRVPEGLRHLIPYAEQWGIGDDLERAELELRARESEKRELASAVEPYREEILLWLDSFHDDPMSDEATAFINMLLALEEMQ